MRDMASDQIAPDINRDASDRMSDRGRTSRPKDAKAEMAALYRAYADQLSTALRQAFGDGPPDPDDVTQRAFEKLLLRDSGGEITNVRGYLWRTARNLIVNEKRAQAVRARHEFEVEHVFFPRWGGERGAEDVLGAKEELRVINDVLRAMPERRRRAFILHRIEGLSVSEVARRLRISRSPADRHIARAAEEIQARLAELWKDDAP